ncbi:hypothetical protein BC833DRAFT_623956 [Globomyces pollinis-pini]|nr:hypothetical protein BC833DRAFT_623956 [Globomyces pollinis-pini]
MDSTNAEVLRKLATLETLLRDKDRQLAQLNEELEKSKVVRAVCKEAEGSKKAKLTAVQTESRQRHILVDSGSSANVIGLDLAQETRSSSRVAQLFFHVVGALCYSSKLGDLGPLWLFKQCSGSLGWRMVTQLGDLVDRWGGECQPNWVTWVLHCYSNNEVDRWGGECQPNWVTWVLHGYSHNTVNTFLNYLKIMHTFLVVEEILLLIIVEGILVTPNFSYSDTAMGELWPLLVNLKAATNGSLELQTSSYINGPFSDIEKQIVNDSTIVNEDSIYIRPLLTFNMNDFILARGFKELVDHLRLTNDIRG